MSSVWRRHALRLVSPSRRITTATKLLEKQAAHATSDWQQQKWTRVDWAHVFTSNNNDSYLLFR